MVLIHKKSISSCRHNLRYGNPKRHILGDSALKQEIRQQVAVLRWREITNDCCNVVIVLPSDLQHGISMSNVD